MSDGPAARHLFDYLERWGRERPSERAMRSARAGGWGWTTWSQWLETSRGIAASLVARGTAPGDRVALLSSTREEWTLCDFGILGARAVTVPIYPTSTAAQAGWILRDSGARAIVVENGTALGVVRQAVGHGEATAALQDVILIDSRGADVHPLDAGGRRIEITTLDDWIHEGEALRSRDPSSLAHRRSETTTDDLATIVYTSGTSGPPRGVMLTHRACIAQISALLEVVDVGSDDEQLLFLPLAHIFARVMLFAQVASGSRLAFAEGTHRMLQNLSDVRPTFFASVPRFFEKMYAVAHDSAEAEGPLKATLFRWAVRAGQDVSRARQAGRAPRWLGIARQRYADQLVLRRIRDTFGGRLRFAVSGGAPLSKELAEWFDACGVRVLEGYGLTEVCGCSHVNRLEAPRFGTVGQPISGIEARVTDDGEILLRGPTLMKGYYGAGEATEAAIDADGWLHTGDIGTIDADGYLTIVDRKKDVIVTAGGSNVAPQNIERLLTSGPWVSQAVVYGDRQKYLVALLTLEPTAIARWAREHDRNDDLEELAKDPEVLAMVQMDVDDANKKLVSYETIKRFALLPRELTVEAGELTETQKVRRARVYERYREQFLALYE